MPSDSKFITNSLWIRLSSFHSSVHTIDNQLHSLLLVTGMYMTKYTFLNIHYSSATTEICIKCKSFCLTCLFNNLRTFPLDSVRNPNFFKYHAKYLMIVSAFISSCLTSSPASKPFAFCRIKQVPIYCSYQLTLLLLLLLPEKTLSAIYYTNVAWLIPILLSRLNSSMKTSLKFLDF